MGRGIFPTSEIPVLTKNQLRQMYIIGLILSKVISTSRMQSISGKYQLSYLEMQKEISTVIEKDTSLNSEITHLKDSECDCENDTSAQLDHPFICASLFLIFFLLCIPYGLFAGLFYIFHDSLLGILIVPWIILVEIIAMPIFFLLFSYVAISI